MSFTNLFLCLSLRGAVSDSDESIYSSITLKRSITADIRSRGTSTWSWTSRPTLWVGNSSRVIWKKKKETEFNQKTIASKIRELVVLRQRWLKRFGASFLHRGYRRKLFLDERCLSELLKFIWYSWSRDGYLFFYIFFEQTSWLIFEKFIIRRE